MALDAAEVRRIAALAQLDVDPDAVEPLRLQLGAMLDLVARLADLPPTDGASVETDADSGGIADPRSDDPREVEDAAGPDPAVEPGTGLFRVPRVLATPDVGSADE